MVQDVGPVGLDGVGVKSDDERVVPDAGIALAATLAARLGIEALVARLVRLRPDRPGAGNAGRKVMALIYAMALGADSIGDCDLPRWRRTRRLLGGLDRGPGGAWDARRRRLSGVWDHCRAHRFFSHARWQPDELGLRLAVLIVKRLGGAGAPVLVAIDDALLQRWGRRVMCTGNLPYRPQRLLRPPASRPWRLRWAP